MTDDTPNTEAALPTAFTPSREANGWTIERQRAFCEALAECGYVERAAASVGMTRQGAYYFKNSIGGSAFSLAWDAALLLSRQRMIDDSIELAFEGSIERIYRDGKLFQEKRKRDPRMMLATIERLGAKTALGTGPVKAVAAEFGAFLDAMEAEARGCRGATADYMDCRAEWGGISQRSLLKESSSLLHRAARNAPTPPPRLKDQRTG
jgi:hypothetical protein